jgi:hypothetical protein
MRTEVLSTRLIRRGSGEMRPPDEPGAKP